MGLLAFWVAAGTIFISDWGLHEDFTSGWLALCQDAGTRTSLQPAFSLSDSVSRLRREVVCFNTPLSHNVSVAFSIFFLFYFWQGSYHFGSCSDPLTVRGKSGKTREHFDVELVFFAATCLIKRSKQTGIKSRSVSVCEHLPSPILAAEGIHSYACTEKNGIWITVRLDIPLFLNNRHKFIFKVQMLTWILMQCHACTVHAQSLTESPWRDGRCGAVALYHPLVEVAGCKKKKPCF